MYPKHTYYGHGKTVLVILTIKICRAIKQKNFFFEFSSGQKHLAWTKFYF